MQFLPGSCHLMIMAVWLLVEILFTGSETAADMTLSLVFFQDFLDFGSKPWIDFQQSFCNVFVDG